MLDFNGLPLTNIAIAGLFALGALLTFRTAWAAFTSKEPNPRKFMAVFRRSMLALAPTGTAMGLMLGQPVIIAAALIIAFEETLETSFVLSALRSDKTFNLP